MGRIDREPQLHIHEKLADEINEMMIGIKIHNLNIEAYPVGSTERMNIEKAQKKIHQPTWSEVLEFLEKAHREINSCTKPMKKC